MVLATEQPTISAVVIGIIGLLSILATLYGNRQQRLREERHRKWEAEDRAAKAAETKAVTIQVAEETKAVAEQLAAKTAQTAERVERKLDDNTRKTEEAAELAKRVEKALSAFNPLERRQPPPPPPPNPLPPVTPG